MSQHNVLVLAFLFPPTAAVGAHRTLRFVKYLPEYDWHPWVVTAQTDFTGHSRDDTLCQRIPAHIRVERTPVYDLEQRLLGPLRQLVQNGRAERQRDKSASSTNGGVRATSNPVLHLLRQMRDRLFFTPDCHIGWSRPAIFASQDLLRDERIDVLYSTSPPHSTHMIALRLKRMTGLPWLADFRDPWAGDPWCDSQRTRRKQRLDQQMERRCVTAADRVVLNTPAMRELFVRSYPDQPEEKFVAIPNGIDPEQVDKIEGLCKAARLLGNGSVVICHPGTLYDRRDPRPFLLAFKRLADSGVPLFFEQFGTIDLAFSLEAFVAEHGLGQHVLLQGMVDQPNALRAMARADILLVVQPGTSIQVPAKLYEMIPFEKPIFALADPGATADLIARYRLGVVTDPDNVDAIAAALRRLIDTKQTHTQDHRIALEALDGRRLTGVLAETLGACAEIGERRRDGMSVHQ